MLQVSRYGTRLAEEEKEKKKEQFWILTVSDLPL